VAEIDHRGHGSSQRGEPLVFTEVEVAAGLARHLDDAGLRLTVVTVRLRSGRAIAPGKIPRGSLNQGAMMGARGASLLRWPASAVVERVEVGES
jgi:alpha-beta hydrolase superfamily lysophospholipase